MANPLTTTKATRLTTVFHERAVARRPPTDMAVSSPGVGTPGVGRVGGGSGGSLIHNSYTQDRGRNWVGLSEGPDQRRSRDPPLFLKAGAGSGRRGRWSTSTNRGRQMDERIFLPYGFGVGGRIV